MIQTGMMIPTTVLEVVGSDSFAESNPYKKVKLSNSMKRCTYPCPSTAIPPIKIKLNSKINFNAMKFIMYC